MKKKVVYFALLLLVFFGYAACRWDYHVSKYIFEKYCNGLVGVFIYEKVGLGHEYFVPIPGGKDPRNLDPRFIFDDNLLLNRERLEQDYSYVVHKATPISQIGPVDSIASSITRKRDGELLSQVVSAVTQLGWWAEFWSFGYGDESCPKGRDVSGVSIRAKNHDSILRSTFFKK